MPRHVDPKQRERDIVDAAVQTLSEGGFPMLTLNNIAKRMGGSTTLITHYFKNRDALINAILERAVRETSEFLDELNSVADPRARLTAVLTWFLPVSAEDLAGERSRIALVAHKDNEPVIQDFLKRMEPAMRMALRTAIMEFVPEEELEPMVDLLRVWTSGVALSAVEHPEIWTPERQVATLKQYLAHLSLPGLAEDQSVRS